MFATSVPLAFVGVLVAPKKNITGKVRWFGFGFKWDQDDPFVLMKLAAVVSAAATPVFLYFWGHLETV